MLYLSSRDLAKYNETIIAFDIPALNERFEMLREIGNLFIVKPENLKTVLNEGCLSRIELNLLYPYVALRSDWSRMAGFERDIFHNVGDHSATIASQQHNSNFDD